VDVKSVDVEIVEVEIVDVEEFEVELMNVCGVEVKEEPSIAAITNIANIATIEVVIAIFFISVSTHSSAHFGRTLESLFLFCKHLALLQS
jgi:hypothetical protein